MHASTTKIVLTFFALATSALADFKVLVPGGDSLWWVAETPNNVIWTCDDSSAPQQFTILVSNSDPKILNAPSAIVAQQDNFDCSRTLTNQQMNFQAGTGYKVILANPLNNTDVYAQSSEFEIKAAGSAYPDASATPNSASASATATGSSSTSSQTSSSDSKSGALSIVMGKTGMQLGVVGVVGGMLASLAL